MRIDTFDFELPDERIAQHPAEPRDAARLLVVGESSLAHETVAELPELLAEGSLVVVNDTRVFPARILGKKATSGGKVEIFLIEPAGEREIDANGEKRQVAIWRALGKSSKPLRFGTDVLAGSLIVHLIGRGDDGLLEVGLTTHENKSVHDAIHETGHVPLPPYIHRDASAKDEERYQTVYARHEGAVAAPTAGLHLTNALLGRLAIKKCEVVSVTLHVGLGTFQPVTVDDLDTHPMHKETYEISKATADAIALAKQEKRPIVAIGTTVVRALESAANADGTVKIGRADTRLLIQPGYSFKIVDRLMTNFHLPKSTLLALVCAFAGTERVLAAYRKAVEEKYRFYSYGDAMLLTRSAE
ncbi:MAG TPA: tRNA preQ1(34) S-adenosylmethionine ribosyltransferase-isomerase QueA [Polyangiaceae bacterium]